MTSATERVYRCPRCGRKNKTRFCPRCKQGGKTMKRVVALIAIMLLTSCTMFGTDAAPAQAAAMGMKDAFMSTSNAFERLISHPKVTMDSEVKASIVAMIRKDRADFEAMEGALVAWLAEVGDLDWKALYDKLRKAYEDIKK